MHGRIIHLKHKELPQAQETLELHIFIAKMHTNKICVLALLLRCELLSASIASQHIGLHMPLISNMLLFTLQVFF